tara:strand:- start:502 stop:678 length:177 start_codon:yes stop_codon:yes gene_type:complete
MRPPQHGNVHFAKIKPISKQNQNKIVGCIFKGEMTFFVAEKKNILKKKEFSPPKIFLV